MVKPERALRVIRRGNGDKATKQRMATVAAVHDHRAPPTSDFCSEPPSTGTESLSLPRREQYRRIGPRPPMAWAAARTSPVAQQQWRHSDAKALLAASR